jgi:hypothetical protein
MQEKRRQEFPLLPGRIRFFDNPDAGELKTIHSHYTSAVKPSCITVASLDKKRSAAWTAFRDASVYHEWPH